jgi:hypothetical protein
MDPEKMDWDAESFGRISYYTRIEGSRREVHFEQVRRDPDDLAPNGKLLSLEIHDRKQLELLLLWTPGGGVIIPETVKPDPKARYLEDQPITAKWSSVKQGYFGDPLSKQAAEWHDARVPEWNRQAKEFQLKSQHLPAVDEVKTLDGTFTLRLPRAYEPDGSWGLVLHYSEFAGRFLPLRLREACDKYKLLYVGLQPSVDPPGRYWRDVAQILDCIVELQRRYKFSPRRTLLASEYATGSVAFAGTLHPELFRVVVLLTHQAAVSDVAPAYITIDDPFPLGWMKVDDWLRNRELGQRWGMIWNESFGRDDVQRLKSEWIAIGIQPHFIRSYARDKLEREKENREPQRCILAEFIEATLGTP